MKQSALGSVFFFQRMVIGLDNYKGKESLSRVVVRLIQNHILTVDLHLEKVLLKKYGRMLKVLMDWLEIQIQVRLLIGHQENLEKGYGIWDTFQKQNIQKCMKHI